MGLSLLFYTFTYTFCVPKFVYFMVHEELTWLVITL